MRVHNFNAGPAALPLPVLERAQRELIDFGGTGMSIMEHSHRGKAYDAVHQRAKASLCRLLGLPENGGEHAVLLLQGGASLQFAMVPMNFLPPGGSADYVVTGSWSEKALKEASRLGKARVAATTTVDGKYARVPRRDELALDASAAYLHLTSNNTIFGTQWRCGAPGEHDFPDAGSVPLVADMSSDFLWRPIDVARFSLVYAGAQKNVGPSGLVVVLVKKSFLERARTDVPTMLAYKTHADNDSLYNTPNTWGIYLMALVLEDLEDSGGLAAMERKNRDKAALLYGAIDEAADFYRCPVERESRSTMNVVFRLPSEELEKRFLAGADDKHMVGLKGHRSVGGVRASLYNAVGLESVAALVEHMRAFRKNA